MPLVSTYSKRKPWVSDSRGARPAGSGIVAGLSSLSISDSSKENNPQCDEVKPVSTNEPKYGGPCIESILTGFDEFEKIGESSFSEVFSAKNALSERIFKISPIRPVDTDLIVQHVPECISAESAVSEIAIAKAFRRLRELRRRCTPLFWTGFTQIFSYRSFWIE